MTKVASIDELKNKKISSLLWQYAIPAIIGTTVNALYNVIDRLFIGNAPGLGDPAISAIGIALPVMTIITAFGMLIGAGSASRISISIGQGDKKTAEKILGNAFLLSLVLTLPMSIILIIFLAPIIRLSNVDAVTFKYTYEFLIYLLPGSIFSTMCFGFNNMMRASGYPKKAMYTMIVSVMVNIILAPIFIFVFEWGMKGAALATVIAMVVGLIFVMQHFTNRTSMIRLCKKNISWDSDIIKSIVSIGLSPFFIQLTASSVAFLIIHQLQHYGGGTAVGAYTIANTVIMLLVMTMMGLTQGMQPIVGYNYGAKNFDRVREVLIYTIKVGIGIGTLGLLVGQLLPGLTVMPFNPTPELAVKATKALRIITMMMPVVGFQIVVTNYFQCIGRAKIAIFLSLSRQFLILIPALFILPPIFGMDGVWASMPIADFLATVITGAVFVWQIKQFKNVDTQEALIR